MEENEILREKAQKVNELESLIARDFKLIKIIKKYFESLES